jgi:uncharacterized protein involved in exopolysaccharide biosynthesis
MISLRTPASGPSDPPTSRFFNPTRRRRAWFALATVLAMVIAGQSVPAQAQ